MLPEDTKKRLTLDHHPQVNVLAYGTLATAHHFGVDNQVGWLDVGGRQVLAVHVAQALHTSCSQL